MNWAERAAQHDAQDALAGFRSQFAGHDDPAVPAYLDGNSLGRPPLAAKQRWADFVETEWGGRLIRGWDEGWFAKPLALGDRIAAATLGAAAGQTIVGDSTTVSLYKLVHAALAARPDRSEIVVDGATFRPIATSSRASPVTRGARFAGSTSSSAPGSRPTTSLP